MEDSIITVRNISKMYRIWQRDDTLRDTITNFIKKKEKPKSFWALKNISFNVNKEEIIGIIGRNGAGKSTLLKIISRITSPTSGEIKIKGRVASLLEVGTGFHPELTGRENIYLNGSVLGMKNKEIDRKFEDIVKFSGIEKFLDTPVKRYSSGMYVRLAFSVAAHLEPEILIVDEVLAVGDVQFQEKCLGKMKEVTESGRTILFVSHNMVAVSNLCQKVILLDEGKIKEIGETEIVIRHYIEGFKGQENLPLADRIDRKFKGDVIVTDIRILDTKTQIETSTVISGQDIVIEVSYETKNKNFTFDLTNFVLGLGFFTHQGQFIFQTHSQQASKAFKSLPPKGRIWCHIPRFPLMAGNYYIKSTLIVDSVPMDQVENAKSIEVIAGDFFKTGYSAKATSQGRQGVYVPNTWYTEFFRNK